MNVHAKPAERAAPAPSSAPSPDRAGLLRPGLLRRRPGLAATCWRSTCRPTCTRSWTPHFQRLGVLAGGRLDELARMADKNGPVLHPRDRFGRDEDWIEYHPAYREMEADRLRRLPVPRHEPSRRRARPRRADASRRQVCLSISVRAGRVRDHVPDQRHRHVDPSHPQDMPAPSSRTICCRACSRATSPRCGRAPSS